VTIFYSKAENKAFMVHKDLHIMRWKQQQTVRTIIESHREQVAGSMALPQEKYQILPDHCMLEHSSILSTIWITCRAIH
jgi:hypothetical protein